MFAGRCVPYVYSISVFINKQKQKWIKTNVFKIFINTLNYSNFSKYLQEKWSRTPMASECVAICTIVLIFVWRFTCFENNEDKMWSLGSIVVSVMDSHSCDRGSSPGEGKHIIRYALNNIQFRSDESSAELVLYLCE